VDLHDFWRHQRLDLDSFTLFDWRLDIPFFRNSVMSIGKQKEPISGERVQSMMFNHMQERTAVSDAMLPSRNVGIVWNGSNPERYGSWAFGVFNDWLDSGEDFDESATQYIGRLTWAPLRSADTSNLLHVGLGYRYSDAKKGFRYRTEPEFNQAPLYVDTGFGTETGVLPADNLQTWTAELSWRRGPWWIASEYTRTDVDNPALGNPTFDGYWLGASWILTGEMRAYNRKSGTFGGVPVSRSVYQNGKGAWELSARWSTIDLEVPLHLERARWRRGNQQRPEYPPDAVVGVRRKSGVRVKCRSNQLWHFTLTPHIL
jgi:phosphate-selective porin OprO/OprP